jgi:phenylacetate-CoA ligase
MSDPTPPDPKPQPSMISRQAARFLQRLRDLERRPLRQLVGFQARRVEELVRHARRNVPFYANRFDAAFDAEDHLDLSRWLDVPILDRATAQANSEALKARETPADAGTARPDRTTGSSGTPFFFEKSQATQVADAAHAMRLFQDHGLDTDGRLCDMRIDYLGVAAYPEGRSLPDWSYGLGSGDYAMLDINTPLADQVEWLVRRQPRNLFTWATNAREIALELERIGETLPLTGLMTSAERCTPGVRADCARVFGVEPVDFLSSREIGIVLFACNEAPVYHLAAESAFIEVIADDGRPARAGETGQIVATGFFNFHMPLIRYATGDYITLSEQPCACGRSLPAVSAIDGRARNRFTRSNGDKLFPKLPESELDARFGPGRWQVVQTGIGAIEVHVETEDAGQTPAEDASLAPLISESLGETVEVKIRSKEKRPDKSGRRKHEQFRSECL